MAVKLYVYRDVEKSHGASLCLDFRKIGVGVGLQWRGFTPRDDGEDPLMLYLSFTCFFKRRGIQCFRSKTFRLLSPREEVSPATRLSLALRGKDYWCDERGAQQLIWNFRRQDQRAVKK